jgi:transglutaminase-like putative cysteine protease
MRIRISHLTNYRYETPATSVIQMLRLTPRNHDGQYVARWRIDVSTDCRLDQHHDAFGNITHAFTAEGPLRELAVTVEGEVETRDTQMRRSRALPPRAATTPAATCSTSCTSRWSACTGT